MTAAEHDSPADARAPARHGEDAALDDPAGHGAARDDTAQSGAARHDADHGTARDGAAGDGATRADGGTSGTPPPDGAHGRGDGAAWTPAGGNHGGGPGRAGTGQGGTGRGAAGAPRRGKARGRLLAGVAALAVAGLVAWGVVGRKQHVDSLQDTADAERIPQVQVISPSKGPPTRKLDLPGSINAWYTASIYAQVTGYVQKWYKDYGAAVKTGELLATIDTPGLDQQLAAAQAELGVAQTRANLASVTARRYKALAGTQAVAQQDIDVQVASAAAAQSQVVAAQANVARYQALEAFKRIVAPFDGVVTSRNTDVGNYVNGGGGDAGAHSAEAALFTVSDIHKMRVFVSVPQDYSDVLKAGLTASLTLPQFPGKSFKADFETSAQSFNAQSRTVVTELTVANPDHTIWPGTYTDVHFEVAGNPDVLIVPEQSLLFRAEGMQVALVGPDDKVHLQDVKLGLNLGQNVQVVDGLKPDDKLINAPSAGEMEGQLVHVVSGAPGIAPAPQFKAAATAAKPKPLTPAQQLKVEAARGGLTDQ